MQEPKIKIKRKVPKKRAPIRVSCQVFDHDDESLETIEIQAKSRKHLNELMFDDLQGRVRIDMEGEPLLSNLSGPAVMYPDGDVDFFINGFPATQEDVPFIDDEVVVDADHRILAHRWHAPAWELEGKKTQYAHGILSCTEHDHAWLVVIGFEGGVEIGVWFHHEFFDPTCEWFQYNSEFDLNDDAIFHTQRFGKRLTEEFVRTGAYGPDNWWFLNEAGRLSVSEQLKQGFVEIEAQKPKVVAQTTVATATTIPDPGLAPYPTDAELEAELEAKAPKESSGFGTMVAAGIATVGIAALGAALNKERIAMQAQAKAEVRA